MRPRWLLLLLLAAPALPAAGQDRIDRRRQARGAVLASAEATYRHYCAHCHGEDGKGDGRLWPGELRPRPADLTATKLDGSQLARLLRDGSAALGKSKLCPPWGRTIPALERRRLVARIETLAGRPPQAAEPAGAELEQPFPWRRAGLLALELVLLGWVLRLRRRNHNATEPDQKTAAVDR